MMSIKRCIVHIPNSIDSRALSGSQIRPLRMIQAFRDCGYMVDVVMGNSHERKNQIKKIKKNIKNGIKYDFLYSESSTMPTLLTDKDHIPRHPFLDFGFWKFCKKNNIRIGLFYRDVQWKFPFYKESVSLVKRMIALPMYRYDLYKYKTLLDVFYLPTKQMKKYLKECPELLGRSKWLMPGCNEQENLSSYDEDERKIINIFYVGGIVAIYDIQKFLEAVSGIDKVNVIICCRKPEWEKVKKKYQKYLQKNIKIVHASGKELDKYYEWADICSVLGGDGDYFSMAMPVKVFEYLGKNKPMLGIKGSASGDFIENEKIGWTTEYSVEDIQKCINFIVEHPNELKEKRENEKMCFEKNTWKARAQQVINDLRN